MENQKKEQRKNKNIVYMALAILTLIITITGATYAYFYTTSAVNGEITGNMASITFDISVTKKTTLEDTKGLIPMTNAMVQQAVSNDSGNGICIDDNSNAVCQIYKISINNSSSASMFFDGYVTLTGGSGTSTDDATATTTMRWVQAFCSENVDTGALSSCTTAGGPTVHQTNTMSWSALSGTGHNTAAILKSRADVIGTATIQGNNYDVISKNYIRISLNSTAGYTQTDDVTSALVYNQYLSPTDGNSDNNTGTSDGACVINESTSKCGYTGTYTDSQVYYIAVWLTETGKDQTAVTGSPNAATATSNFFEGVVTFKSAEGNEVTAAFGDYIAVNPGETPSTD